MIEFFNHIKLHSKGSDIVLLAMVTACVLALAIAPGRSKTSDEPDCSPHPFDIMAIFALYQTVDINE